MRWSEAAEAAEDAAEATDDAPDSPPAKKKVGRGPGRPNFTAVGKFNVSTLRAGKDLSNAFYRRSLALVKKAKELHQITGCRVRAECLLLTKDGTQRQ